MKYIVAEKNRVSGFGINTTGHRMKEPQVIISEKELDVVPGASFSARVKAVGGKVYSNSAIKKIIKEGGWV